MKKLVFALALAISSTSSFAGLSEMMKVYNNPKSAPKVASCKGDIYCNGFIALSKQWKDIPNSYRYKGEYEIKSYAKKGVSYNNRGSNIGLQSGFYWSTDKSHRFIDSIDTYIDSKGHVPFSDKNGSGGYEGGLAVLLYIEDKNNWVIDY